METHLNKAHNSTVLISAVVCTHNRAGYLATALESLLRQTLPARHYEIIIVDNRSTDDTASVVGQFSSLRSVRYVYEPALGLAPARNTGWRQASGRYVAYLDDDAVASSRWLEKIIEVFENVTPRPGCVGGKTEPIWEAPRPGWLDDRLLAALSIIDWSSTPHFINDLSAEWLVGTNIAFPRDVLQTIGGFVPGLDRRGAQLMSSGDVFLERQLLNAGYFCYYHPEVSVSHHITPSRLSKSWFLRRFYWQGISDVTMEVLKKDLSARQRLRLAIGRAKPLLLTPGKLSAIFKPTDDPGHFREQCFAFITLGQIRCLLFSAPARR
ncbi:MAG TPA: glycosyltransferase [Candidatus Eisenbacteria bacterium]|nr:glycosyltransferase [Candidatus Eisenbacteria bacterium]